jgi:hypothetical protein
MEVFEVCCSCGEWLSENIVFWLVAILNHFDDNYIDNGFIYIVRKKGNKM